jgi:hypothetical protein
MMTLQSVTLKSGINVRTSSTHQNNEKSSYEHGSREAYFPSYSPLQLYKISNVVSTFVAFTLYSEKKFHSKCSKYPS